eukprot:evm.model.scf_2484.2 EVM.evm.TU.scf_2484.2   scf_2484:20589-21928(-)
MDGAFPSERGQSFDGFSGESGYGRGQRRGFRGTAENAKTKLCLRWLAGECRFGSRCNFAHGEHELRKLPPKSSPSRFSQDREPSDKDRGRGRPGGFFGSVSFDSGYRPMNARPSMYDYRSGGGGASYGGTYANGAGPYSRVYGATPNSGYGPVGRGSGPIHVAAAHSPNPPPRDFYAVHGYPVPGPNAWTMYRDPESGEPYYHNHHTNVTQWNRPQEWPQ